MQDERLDRERNEEAKGEDSRQPYVPPTLTTVESRLSALLGSQCPPDEFTGIPDG